MAILARATVSQSASLRPLPFVSHSTRVFFFIVVQYISCVQCNNDEGSLCMAIVMTPTIATKHAINKYVWKG